MRNMESLLSLIFVVALVSATATRDGNVTESERDKRKITTKDKRYYSYQVLLFVISNAPQTEQQKIISLCIERITRPGAVSIFYIHFYVPVGLLSLFAVVQFKNNECTSSNGDTGVCYTSTECTNNGGSASGNCAVGFGVCCIIE